MPKLCQNLRSKARFSANRALLLGKTTYTDETRSSHRSKRKGEIPMARRDALGICLIALLAIVAVTPARAKDKTPEANAPCTQATFQNIFLDITSWTDVNTYPAGTAAKSLPNLPGLAPGGSATIKVDICRVAFTIDKYIDVDRECHDRLERKTSGRRQ